MGAASQGGVNSYHRVNSYHQGNKGSRWKLLSTWWDRKYGCWAGALWTGLTTPAQCYSTVSVANLPLPSSLLLPLDQFQIVPVSKTTDVWKSFRTIFQRSCRPTSGSTTPGVASSTPRWSKSSQTCGAWTKSTPSNTALCPSSLSTACSSPRWCLRCLAVRCHSKARAACSPTNRPQHTKRPPILNRPPSPKKDT